MFDLRRASERNEQNIYFFCDIFDFGISICTTLPHLMADLYSKHTFSKVAVKSTFC